jgi:glycosyltransferase involved in cell wall biosynthesis
LTGSERLPRITVVTPSLDAAETIERALASVAEQDYPDLEHVVIDGGSTDGTLDVLHRTSAVRWVSEPDSGLSNALNKGLAMATGDIIGWLNADDFYLPGSLRAVGRAFGAEPASDWVTGPCLIVDAADAEIRSAVTGYKRALLRRYSRRSLLVQNFVAAPSTFARADALRAIGGFDEGLRLAMDYDAWLKLARRTDPIVLGQPLAAFRMAEGSLSMSAFERQFAEHAAIARRHGEDHELAVTLNAVMSRVIVFAYARMRDVRRLRRSRVA